MDRYFQKLIELVHKDTTSRKKDKNLDSLQLWTVIYFLIALVLIAFYEDIFETLGMGDPENEDINISTLGISATIMILYNMIGWPYLEETTNDKYTNTPIDKIENDEERARTIVTQVDLICDYATGIMTKVKDLTKKEDQDMTTSKDDHQKNDYVITFYDKLNK